MAGRIRQFPCGHSGRGQYCHHCRQLEAARLAASNARSEERQAWQSRLAGAPLPLDALPRQAAEKCLQVVERLQQGVSYMDLQGKRLAAMNQRQIISIPLGWSFRLICRERAGVLEYLEAISHETYNNRLASGGWEHLLRQ